MRRLLGTLAHLTYEKRRPAYKYENLARNGYLFRWAVPLLVRWKARDRALVSVIKRKRGERL